MLAEDVEPGTVVLKLTVFQSMYWIFDLTTADVNLRIELFTAVVTKVY